MSAALKPPGTIFLDFLSWKILPYGDFTWLTPVDFTRLERDIRDRCGLGGGSTTTVADLVSPRRRSDSAYVVAICTCTDGKGAFMSWLVKSTGVGCVKTSWCYFPGFFFLENFTLWRFYVADASRFY